MYLVIYSDYALVSMSMGILEEQDGSGHGRRMKTSWMIVVEAQIQQSIQSTFPGK